MPNQPIHAQYGLGIYGPIGHVWSGGKIVQPERLPMARFFCAKQYTKGDERMTDKIEACAAILSDAAIERARENPELARADFESFCNVMWTDDSDMKRAGLTREEFRIALQSAWMKMPKADQHQ